MRTQAATIWFLLLLAAAGASLGAQEVGRGRATVPPDPWTAGNQVRMQRLGYDSVGGPFAFGSGHDTTAVAELLADEPLLWVETAHFRIGCSLSPLRIRGDFGSEWIESVRTELKQLAGTITELRTDTRELDPWLRVHLIAFRLERLYAEVAANLRDADRDPKATALAGASGNGPFLGMEQKFTVLLVRKASSLARYTRAFCGTESTEPLRWHDRGFGSVLWGAAEETSERLFANDLALHAHLVFNVAHNLYSSYRGHERPLPPWVVVGLGHWHSRKISTRYPAFDRKRDRDRTTDGNFWLWEKRIDSMLRNGTFQPLSTFCAQTDARAFGIEQDVQSWALVSFLMAAWPDPFLRFVRLCKEPTAPPRRGQVAVETRPPQLLAIEQALHLSLPELEAKWREFVLRRK